MSQSWGRGAEYLVQGEEKAVNLQAKGTLYVRGSQGNPVIISTFLVFMGFPLTLSTVHSKRAPGYGLSMRIYGITNQIHTNPFHNFKVPEGLRYGSGGIKI